MESGKQRSSSWTPPQGIELRNKDNPLVFMDLSLDGNASVKLVIELFKDEMPIAAENFRALCTGEKGIGLITGKPLHYKGTVFYRMHERLYAEGGDIENNDGTGGESIYGGTFKAESDERIRSKRGMVYMVHDAQMIDSKFIIVFQQHFFISCDYVVVGRVLERMESLEQIERYATDTGKPSGLVKVTDCGQLSLPQGIGLRHKDNPLVFMDLSIDGNAAVKLVIELFKDEMPIAAENFRALCTGEKGIGLITGKPLHYKGTVFYRMHERLYAEGGDIENNDGTGGESIYGGTFKAESDEHIRSKRGMVYMVHDAQMIDSKFIIVFQQHFFISWDYVVVGRVLERMESLEQIERYATDTGKPSGLVKVTDCGELSRGNMIRF